eukprot:TRINITY_DN15778_c0_g1_i1.p1 TRINITY_DN15778_c0_g1~~TRINITY_DN15778_c0_g1_i1.p1  ORF type:complete len:362 (-),score=70.38 TRINITY_DN15778_c0_g1_i1:160-1245(-)
MAAVDVAFCQLAPCLPHVPLQPSSSPAAPSKLPSARSSGEFQGIAPPKLWNAGLGAAACLSAWQVVRNLRRRRQLRSSPLFSSPSRRRGIACRAVAVAQETAVAWPSEVAGYRCRTVSAVLPTVGEVSALVVDETAGVEETNLEEVPDWVPKAWLSPVVGDSEVEDIYGAIGIWPAAFVASDELLSWFRGAREGGEPWSCIEIGCGAGFPALVAARLGAQHVQGVDTERLPLDLLEASWAAQRWHWPAGAEESSCPKVEVIRGRAGEVSVDGIDVVLVSDLLYSQELGEIMGECLGKAAKAGQHVILTDGRRSGRESFLQAFQAAYGSPGRFEDVPVPTWAPERTDFFDSSQMTVVGVFRY